MNKIITLYELLGLIKDGKAPKKVLILDKVYYLLQDGDKYIYSQNSHDLRNWDMFIDNKINISRCLDYEVLILDEEYEVEILDDEDKEIEELNPKAVFDKDGYPYYVRYYFDKINELVREINKLKKEGK